MSRYPLILSRHRSLSSLRERFSPSERQRGKWGYILAWLIGVPIPILLLVYLLRGCT